MGPLLAVKLLAGRQVSFIVLGLSQVLIDVEVLVRMKLGSSHLHGISNTLTGAVAVGLLATAAGPPTVRLTHGLWNAAGPPEALRLPPRISWRTAAISAFIGTFSHILLDAIMHADAQPFAPLSPANPLLRAVGVGTLHDACLAIGAVAAVGLAGRWIAVRLLARRATDAGRSGGGSISG